MKITNVPTIRAKFFRALMLTGCTVGLIAVLSAGFADAYSMRRVLIDNLLYYSEAMARVAAYNIDNREELNHHLRDFNGMPGVELSCVYDANGKLLASWQKENLARECPAIISEMQVKQTLFSVVISRPVTSGEGEFGGMIHLEAALVGMHFLVIRLAVSMLATLALAFALCFSVARRTAVGISLPLNSLEQHIQCLVTASPERCAIPSSAATQETARLFSAVANLRAQLVSGMISREEASARQRWQEARLSGLLTLLNSRLPENSPLLPCVADYALLLRLDHDFVHEHTVFNLQETADLAFYRAKRIHPPGPFTHATMSLKSGMPRQWKGDVAMVEALLRHLMLIALRRTEKGLACLRIESGSQKEISKGSILYFSVEDTGTEINAQQVMRWLREAGARQCALQDPLDLSWLVVGDLVAEMGGEVHVCSESGKGLSLQGWIPMEAAAEVLPASPVDYGTAAHAGATPLILLVEDDRVNRHAQRSVLEQAGYDVFMTSSGTQALEWASALPFTLFMIDQMLPDMPGNQVGMRLQKMVQEGRMSEAPIVALSAADTAQLRQEWSAVRPDRLLAKPLGEEAAHQLKRMSIAANTCFFDEARGMAANEAARMMQGRLPVLRQTLRKQLLAWCEHAERAPDEVKALMQEAHAVKSAALTLGYETLATCMDAVERHVADSPFFKENVSVLIKYLRYFLAESQNQAQRVVLSS